MPLVMPPSAGVFSSFGLLYAEVEYHFARTFRRLLRQADLRDIAAAWDALARQASDQLPSRVLPASAPGPRCNGRPGIKGPELPAHRAGAGGPSTRGMATHLEQAFAEEHEHTYGHRAGPDEPVERSRSSSSGRACARAAACRKASRRAAATAPRKPRVRPISATPMAGWRRLCWAAPTSPVGAPVR